MVVRVKESRPVGWDRSGQISRGCAADRANAQWIPLNWANERKTKDANKAPGLQIQCIFSSIWSVCLGGWNAKLTAAINTRHRCTLPEVRYSMLL